MVCAFLGFVDEKCFGSTSTVREWYQHEYGFESAPSKELENYKELAQLTLRVLHEAILMILSKHNHIIELFLHTMVSLLFESDKHRG